MLTIAVNLKGKVHSQVQVSTETVCRQTYFTSWRISPHRPIRGPLRVPLSGRHHRQNSNVSQTAPAAITGGTGVLLFAVCYVCGTCWRVDEDGLPLTLEPSQRKWNQSYINLTQSWNFFRLGCWGERKHSRIVCFGLLAAYINSPPDTSMRIISSWSDHWYFCVTSLIIWSTGKSLFSVRWSQSGICSLNTKPEAHPKLLTVFANGDYTIAFMGISNFSEVVGKVSFRMSSWERLPVRTFFFSCENCMEQMTKPQNGST